MTACIGDDLQRLKAVRELQQAGLKPRDIAQALRVHENAIRALLGAHPKQIRIEGERICTRSDQ